LTAHHHCAGMPIIAAISERGVPTCKRVRRCRARPVPWRDWHAGRWALVLAVWLLTAFGWGLLHGWIVPRIDAWRIRTVEQAREVLAGTHTLEFTISDEDGQRYAWIGSVLGRLAMPD